MKNAGGRLPAGGRPRRLAAGHLDAVFLPGLGMLGASLRHRGVELLRRTEDLVSSAAKGSTAGIPLLHPWANRLGGTRYRAAGREVVLDPSSPLLHLDDRGLPIHGVPWSRLAWEVLEESPARLLARLDWRRPDLLVVFPFPHALEMDVTLSPEDLTIAVTLVAGAEGAVPVSFGFHPYLGLAGAPRASWRLELPAMQRLPTDERGIPEGREEAFRSFDAPLGNRGFDDGFAISGNSAAFAISEGSSRIAVELLEGYRFAQVYAPPAQDLVALEPMTAPSNALVSGRGLTIVPAGSEFRAALRIRVEDHRAPESRL